MGVILHMTTIHMTTVVAMATFYYECVVDRKVKKLAYVPEYWLDFAKILYRGVFFGF